MGNKFIIIDVDALLGVKNKLLHPCCARAVCDKAINFRGKDGRCKRGRWCANAQYHPEDITEYRSGLNVTYDNCYMAVLPVLDKLADAGWLFSLWTTRPRKQTFNIISVLRETGIWQKTKMFSWTPLLLNNNCLPDDGSFSPATEKLTLFEREYGNIRDRTWPLVAIESDPLEASILQSYCGRDVAVHLSPKIWLDVLVTDVENIDGLLVSSQSKDFGISVVDQAS